MDNRKAEIEAMTLTDVKNELRKEISLDDVNLLLFRFRDLMTEH